MSQRERRKVDGSSKGLTFAVHLRDTFRDGQPRGTPTVALTDRPERFTVNPSGFYVLSDLPDDVSSVTVLVDAGDQYLPEEREVNLDELDDETPVETIDLHPSPAYRFPGNATLVRGFVLDPDGDPLPDVDLTVTDWAVETRSNEDGEFVLYFEGLTADDVTEQDGKQMVTIEKDDPTIEATHAEHDETTASVAVEEGKTAVVDIDYSDSDQPESPPEEDESPGSGQPESPPGGDESPGPGPPG